jgi:addiction module RelE/StbE family toxin
MRLDPSSGFEKQLRKAPLRVQKQVRVRLDMLLQDEYYPLLRNHKLTGPYEGYRSINVSGDWRIVYKKISTTTFFLYAVGTHSELYS